MLWITLYLSECRSLRELANLVCLKVHNYNTKQVISVTSWIYDYLLANVREPLILRELREKTAPMRGSQMQVSLIKHNHL
ncbi:putative caffeoyl-CoA O-methyltransferase [Helianthus anomalus]